MSPDQYRVSPYDRPEDWVPIAQGNTSPSTSAMLREYEWSPELSPTGARDVKITKAPIVTGTDPRSRHPFPHNPVDPGIG